MKKLLLFTFALFLWTGAWADKTVWLNPGSFENSGTHSWDEAGAVVEAWVWETGHDGRWVSPTYKMKVSGTTYYKFVVNNNEDRVIFHRAGTVENAHKWNNDDVWAEVKPGEDATFVDNTLYTITGWNSCSSGTFTGDPYSGATKKTVYLWPNTDWKAANANFSVYAFSDDNNNCWIPLSLLANSNNGVYTAEVPVNCSKMIFVRGNETKAPITTFNNKWNQTGDISLEDVANNTIFKIATSGSGDTDATYTTSTNLALLGTASASINDKTVGEAIDGNNGTRWGSGVDGRVDADWFQVEWTTAQTFNTIRLLCENAMNKDNAPQLEFKIQTSDNGETWTDQRSVSGKNAGNGEFITAQFANPVTAKFVRFQGVKQGMYGYSFFEFEVYNYADPLVLSWINITANKTSVKSTRTATFTVSGKDQLDGVMTPAFLTWESTNTSVGEVEEFDGKYIFTAGTVGETTITAKGNSGALSSNSIIMTVTPMVLPTDVPTPEYSARNVVAIYTDKYGDVVGISPQGANTPTDKEINEKKAKKVENFTWFQFAFNADTDVTGMDKVHFDIFPVENMSSVVFTIIGNESQNNQYHNSALVEGTWNSLDFSISDLPSTHHLSAIQIHIENAGGHRVDGDGTQTFYIGNIYFYKESETVNVTAAGYATYVSEYDLNYGNVDGLKAWKVKVNNENGVLTFSPVTNVPAGEGVLLQTENGGSDEFVVPSATETVDWEDSDNDFIRGTGSAVESTTTEDANTYYNYILNKVDDVVGFYHANNQTVATNRAYIRTTYNTVANSKPLTMEFVDDDNTQEPSETDGIDTIHNAEFIMHNDAYNLAGQRVGNDYKGIVVINGKKYLRK